MTNKFAFNRLYYFLTKKIIQTCPMRSLIILFFSSAQIFAQVGINTVSPDDSAVLDIWSTEAGMLTPRMTSAQRIAISNPATGLLVYDTDEASFYYFDVNWIPLEGGRTEIITSWLKM